MKDHLMRSEPVLMMSFFGSGNKALEKEYSVKRLAKPFFEHGFLSSLKVYFLFQVISKEGKEFTLSKKAVQLCGTIEHYAEVWEV